MKASMNTTAFNRLLEATKAFQSKCSTKPVHNYIRLEFHAEDNEVIAIAVDGYRMSVEHAVAQSDEDFTVYVKGNVKLPKHSEVFIELSGNEVIFRCNDCLFGYVQPKGDFIEWQGVIPKGEPGFKIAFNGDYLLSALQAAKASCGDCYKNAVVLEFRSNLEPVILRTNKKDIKMVLPIRITD